MVYYGRFFLFDDVRDCVFENFNENVVILVDYLG